MPVFGVRGENPEARVLNPKSVKSGPRAFAESALSVTAGGAIDLVDSTLASVSNFTPLNVERGSITSQVPIINENRGAAEIGGAVLGIVGASIVAPEVTALRLGGLAKGGSFAAKLFVNNDRVNAAVKAVKLVDLAAAAEGATGAAAINARVFGLSRANQVRAAQSLAFRRDFAQGVAIEATLAATQNENEFLFPSDLGIAGLSAFAVLGIGTTVIGGRIATGAAIRRNAVSDLVSRTRAGMLDPANLDEVKVQATRRAFADVRSGGSIEQPITFGGANVDIAITEALQGLARETTETSVRALAANRSALTPVNRRNAIDAINKVTVRGLPGSQNTGFRLAGDAPSQTVLDALLSDPHSLDGVEFLGRIPTEGGISQAIEGKARKAATLRVQAAKALKEAAKADDNGAASREAGELIRQADALDRLVPVVLDRGEILHAASFEARPRRFVGDIPNAERLGGTDLTQRFVRETGIGLRSDGELTLPKGKKSLGDLTFLEMSSLFRLGNAEIERLSTKSFHVVPENPTFFHLDLAEELLRRTDGSVSVSFPQGLTRETAQVESFAQKAEALAAREFETDDILAIRETFNLPGLTAFQRQGLLLDDLTPAEALLRKFGDPKEIRKTPLPLLKQQAARAQKGVRDLEAIGPSEVDLLGTSFNPQVSPSVKASAQPVEPVLAFTRPIRTTLLDETELTTRLANAQVVRLQHLVGGETSTPLVQRLTSQLLASGDLPAVLRVSELDDIALTKSLNPQSTNRGGFTFRNFTFRDSKTNLAAQRIFRDARAVGDRGFDDLLLETAPGTGKQITNVIGELSKSSARGSAQLARQFVAARRGFSLSGKTRVAESDGRIEFFLADTPGNRVQFKAITGKELTGTSVLPLANGASLGVDEAAFEAIQAIGFVADNIRTNKNAILRSRGLPEIRKEPFYVPPENGKFRALILGSNDRALRTITADSPEQLEAAIAAQRRDSDSFFNKNKGARIKTEQEILESNDLLSRAEVEFLDASIPEVQSGRQATLQRRGSSATPFRVSQGIDAIIRQLREQHRRLAPDILATVFDAQIAEARGRAVSAGAKKATQRGPFGKREIPGVSIQRDFVNDLLGRKAIDSPSSQVGRVIHPLEGFLNLQIKNAFGPVSRLLLGGSEKASQKEFLRLREELGKRLPFENAQQLIEERGFAQAPPEIADVAQKINAVAAALLLRFDSAHAAINMLGLITTMPSVMANATRRVGESSEEFARRFGRDGHIFIDTQGRTYGAFDHIRAVGRGIARSLSQEGSIDRNFAATHGMLDGRMMELQQQLSLINNPATAKRFWKGDPTAKSFVARKGADGLLGFISDSSENLARSISHFTGLEYARMAGITDLATQHSFAQQLADSSIANFNPLNRPEIFQSSGVGATLGLFQSYIFNYYSRLFGYIENRQTRLLAVQGAMQSMVFGANTVPGFSQASQLIFNSTDGERDIFDGIYERLPGPVADAIMHGVPSTLPLIFGGTSDDSPVFFTRGDVRPNIIGSGALGLPVPAGINVATTLFKGVGEGIRLFSSDNPGLTDQQVGEIVQRHVVNRPLSGMIGLFWTRAQTDASGNLIAEETRSALGAIARATGIKTLAQQKQIEANVQFRRFEAQRLQRRATLTTALKSAIRGGNIDQKKLENALVTFIDTGGSPDEFGGFIRNLNKSALNTEAQRALTQQLANPRKMSQRSQSIMRLMRAVTPDEDLPDQ